GGMAWLTGIGVTADYALRVLGPLMVVGIGLGLIYAAALTTGTSGVAAEDAGIASACISAGQQLGGASGTALLNTIAATATVGWLHSHLRARPSTGQLRLAAVHGYTTVFWWCAAIFAAGVVVTALLLRRGPLPPPPPPPPPPRTPPPAPLPTPAEPPAPAETPAEALPDQTE